MREWFIFFLRGGERWKLKFYWIRNRGYIQLRKSLDLCPISHISTVLVRDGFSGNISDDLAFEEFYHSCFINLSKYMFIFEVAIKNYC